LLYTPSEIDDNILSGNFRVYPTLFSDRLYVESTVKDAGSQLVISDIFGRQVMNSDIPKNGKASIDVASCQKVFISPG
jgi:hypothetical protein